MDDQDVEITDPLALSRLDVISCGLGGAVLLGIVFTVVRHQPPAAVSAPPFILIEWKVKSAKDEVFPLINAVIQPPAGAEEFDLPLEEFDLRTGRLKSPSMRQKPDSLIYRTGTFELLGFSRFGDEDPIRTTKAGVVVVDDNASSTPTFRIRIANPQAGEWQFRARYQNNRNARNLSDDQALNTIQVFARAFTREKPNAIEGSPNPKPLSFGMTDDGISVTVMPLAK